MEREDVCTSEIGHRMQAGWHHPNPPGRKADQRIAPPQSGHQARGTAAVTESIKPTTPHLSMAPSPQWFNAGDYNSETRVSVRGVRGHEQDRIEKRRAMEEERVLGEMERRRTEEARQQVAENEQRRKLAQKERWREMEMGLMHDKERSLKNEMEHLARRRTPHLSSSPSPQHFHNSQPSSAPLVRVPQEMAPRQQRRIDAPQGGGLGLGLRQEEVPGPITVASLASNGLMSRHLRLHGEHVAPGDIIIALDGKAVELLSLEQVIAIITSPVGTPSSPDYISFVLRSRSTKRAYAVKVPRLRRRDAEQGPGMLIVEGYSWVDSRNTTHSPRKPTEHTSEDSFWTHHSDDPTGNEVQGRMRSEGWRNEAVRKHSVVARWSQDETSYARAGDISQAQAAGEMRSSFVDLQNLRKSFAELPELNWLLGSGASLHNKAGLVSEQGDPQQAQAVTSRRPSEEQTRTHWLGAVTSVVTSPRTPGQMEEEEDMPPLPSSQSRPAITLPKQVPRLPELPYRLRNDNGIKQREPAPPPKQALPANDPRMSPKKARADTFCPEREFTFEDLGLKNLHTTHTVDEHTTSPTDSPPLSYRQQRELDQHDDVTDWMLLGGSIQMSTQLDPPLPHPRMGEDTRREVSRNRPVPGLFQANKEPVAGEAWVMDEEDLLELSLQAHQEGLAIRGLKDLAERPNARLGTVDSDVEDDVGRRLYVSFGDRPTSPSVSYSHAPPVSGPMSASSFVTRISSFGQGSGPTHETGPLRGAAAGQDEFEYKRLDRFGGLGTVATENIAPLPTQRHPLFAVATSELDPTSQEKQQSETRASFSSSFWTPRKQRQSQMIQLEPAGTLKDQKLYL